MARIEDDLDFCQGCKDERAAGGVATWKTLPEGWQEGDPIPDDVTRHGTPRERAEGRAPFVFKYGRSERVVLKHG